MAPKRPKKPSKRVEKCEQVHVYVRARPHKKPVIRCTSRSIRVEGHEEPFDYDRVLGPDAGQADAYDAVRPMLFDALNDMEATVLAYGQTGSGKTHTMSGTRQEPGIVPQALAEIFAADPDVVVTMTYVELYKDKPHDLLNRGAPLRIMGMKTVGHKECVVAPDFWPMLDRVTAARTTASTGENARSSRSHAIMTLRVEQSSMRRAGVWRFVDLAGSETTKSVQTDSMTASEAERRAQETAEINKSLSFLVNVLEKLSRGEKVFFRDCKLTQLLSDAFTNNKCAMLACVRSDDNKTHRSETLRTLELASRAKKIKHVVKRKRKKLSRVQQIQHELDEAKRALAEANARGKRLADHEELEELYTSMREEPRNNTLHRRLLVRAMGKKEMVIDPEIDRFFHISQTLAESLLNRHT